MAGNWGDNKVHKLLTLTEFNSHLSGIVKDGLLLERLAKRLNDRNYARDKWQVTTKLKALRKKISLLQQWHGHR